MLMGNTVEISLELYRELIAKQCLVALAGGEESVSAYLPPAEKREFLTFKNEVTEGQHDPVKVDY